MTKYDLVLYAGQCSDFIERLRELGLVDITTAGWEPSEEERQLLLDIEGHGKAVDYLKAWQKEEAHAGIVAAPCATGAEAYARYAAAQREATALRAEVARMEKAAEELRPWGAFDAARIQALAAQGIVLRYFTTPLSTFQREAAGWADAYTLSEAARSEAAVWFVVVTAPGEELSLDAQEVKAPTMDFREAERRIAEMNARLAELDGEFACAAASVEAIEAEAAGLKERLQSARVQATAREAADGMLVVLEGWAEADTASKVDALLEEYPNVVYIKSMPTPEDDTPVQLRNDRFSRVFELVGDMYARPKYGTLDLTPFFAPFYMLFFGICLNDAGYGLILLAMGLGMLWKVKEPGMMRQAAWFATLCAASTVLFGLVCGSFFGMNLKEYFPSVPFYDFQGKFFTLSLVIGVVQILFAMVLNIWTRIRCFGIGQALGAIGWFIVLLSCCLAMGLPMAGMAIPGFTAGSTAFYAALGIGALLMLVLNTPGRNPLINIGAGLWDFYNNLTGLLSDVLSYIRLFAIGLSGGVLALVFNTLATGFAANAGGMVGKLLIMIPILLVGHGINLFMSTISSFVHPMRLTFVEFFKNAGFEMASRSFDPIRKMNK